jgi:vacuolar-type H+-ATPase subunit E/Vma4
MPGTAGPLLEQIRSSAVASAADIVTRARADAELVREDARKQAERRRTAAVAARARTAAEALSRTRAETAVRVGRDTLAARAAALDRIFAAAAGRFASLATHPALGAILAETLSDGFTYVPDGAVTVRCPTAIAGRVREALGAITRSGVTLLADDAMPFGVRIEAADGSFTADGTFARRMARERSRLSAILANRLAERTS